MTGKFIGRKEELQSLSRLLKKQSASLVVIQGRRRIGKSRLIEEFSKKYRFFPFSGLFPTANTMAQTQRNAFSMQLNQVTGLPELQVDDWSKLFLLLYEKIKTDRVVVLFDEISWMGSKDPDFLGKLKNAWDLYFKKNPKLILFLCGSASAWIEKNILSSTGFVGRISYRLTLGELNLQESSQFWPKTGGKISAYEKIKVLSVTGGVPRYLEEINPHMSAEENINDLCFRKGGPLVNEFNDIFSDLFHKKSPTYKKVVTVLANGPCEIKEIAETLSMGQSGFLSEYLEDLMKSGFITRDYTWHIQTGRVSRLSHYRLSDNYLRFYLKYIDKNIFRIQNNEFLVKSVSALAGFESVMGFQFENLILNNRKAICKRLNIKPESIVSNNPYFQRKTEKHPGCQIDYLIQTKFNELYLCEIKFSKNLIMPTIIPEVEKKIASFIYPKKFSCKPVLIHVNGVHEDIVNSVFFAEIIDFGHFLEIS